MEFMDGSVDLITVCDAVHWFEIARFFVEAKRILVPGGVLAIMTAQKYFLAPNENHSDELNRIIIEVSYT